MGGFFPLSVTDFKYKNKGKNLTLVFCNPSFTLGDLVPVSFLIISPSGSGMIHSDKPGYC